VLSEQTRAERKLGWMLCAPAAIVMFLVTAYPICYAIYLSLLRADLRFPNQRTWVGLDNYVTVLTAGVSWRDLWHTVLITLVSVSIELVLGMLLALIMHRAIFGRGLIRTSALVAYGIVTVVAASPGALPSRRRRAASSPRSSVWDPTRWPPRRPSSTTWW
jgi:multiple sugar transport system permease protein